MNKILAMREKRGEVWDKAKAFLNEHQDENGMLSPEDAAQYERMEQEVVDLGHAIEREERAAQMERELNAPTMAPLASRPEARPDSRTGRGSNEYKAAFWTAMRNRGGHLSVQNALQIGTDSEGGYLVPDEYERTLCPRCGMPVSICHDELAPTKYASEVGVCQIDLMRRIGLEEYRKDHSAESATKLDSLTVGINPR